MGNAAARPSQKRNVRALALQVVMQTLEEGKYCDKVLHRVLEDNAELPKQDRAFLTRLSEGTVERCIEIDYIIGQFSKVPVSRMKPVIRCILRMAVYQFMYMDQVPNRAACDEAVKLVIKRHMQGLRGFVNGVLRNIERNIGEISYPDRQNFEEYASVKYSMPIWIIQYFLQEYSQDTVEEILQSYLTREHSTTIRCNQFLGYGERETAVPDATRATAVRQDRISEIMDSLKRQGVQVKPGYFMPEALRISGYDRIEGLEVFQQGKIQVQAESSMVVGAVSDIRQGQTVLDVCAAPGGKSMHAADLLQGKGIVLCCDLSEAKVYQIQENMERAGVEHCELYKQDARILRKDWIGTVDVLIADLPCSGLGVLGKKCDIKYHTKQEDVNTLAALQREILQTASRYVTPGGIMLYSTCTMGAVENEQNVRWIEKNLPFHLESMEDLLPEPLRGRTGTEGFLQILPTDHTDGFFIAKFRRDEQNTGRDDPLVSARIYSDAEWRSR